MSGDQSSSSGKALASSKTTGGGLTGLFSSSSGGGGGSGGGGAVELESSIDSDGEDNDDLVVDLADFDYKVTQESALPAHIATERFVKHWMHVRTKYDLPGNQNQYLMAILMDMAVNGSSGKRSGDNFLLYGGARIPCSLYLKEIGSGEVLRKFGRYYYPVFLATLTQDNDPARRLLKILTDKWGVSSSIAPYVVDFVNINSVPANHQLFVKTLGVARTVNGDAAAYKYLKQMSREAQAQALGGSASSSAGPSAHDGGSGGALPPTGSGFF